MAPWRGADERLAADVESLQNGRFRLLESIEKYLLILSHRPRLCSKDAKIEKLLSKPLLENNLSAEMKHFECT